LTDTKQAQPVLDAIVLGAGFGGLHALYRLRENGLSVLALEAAPDVGGAWYWNRYPGARCDVESLVYCYTFSPVLDEEWTWSERYPAQPEIQEYLSFAADRLDLRKDIRFNARLAKAWFDRDETLWNFETEAGDRYKAKHFVSSAGPITKPILPDIEGIESFKGELIHTARWPQTDPEFAGKRVGIIGTGSSGTQAIQAIAPQCGKLTVFLRTPNFYAPAMNRPLTQEDYDWWKENRELTRQRLRKCHRWGGGDIMLDDAVNDTMFEPAGNFTPEQRQAIYETRYRNGGGVVGWAFADAMVKQDVNDEAADFLRSKIKTIVKDPETAEKLTPRGYAYGTKRCVVGTDYYDVFNRDNVELVDVKTDRIERITETGVIVNGRLIELDILVLASGFDALTGAMTAIDLRGAGGTTLKEVWAAGPTTHLGISVNGFPNMYMIGGPGSPSVLTNVVMTNEMQVEWIAELIDHIEKNNLSVCEAKADAEDNWTQHVSDIIQGTLWETADSWYVGANVPGKPRTILAYAGGFAAYDADCAEEARNGYPGFEFT
jgi:cyclohexanone monooxygenase